MAKSLKSSFVTLVSITTLTGWWLWDTVLKYHDIQNTTKAALSKVKTFGNVLMHVSMLTLECFLVYLENHIR